MVEIVELFETGAEGYWNWFCKGLWFPCIAGYMIVFETSRYCRLQFVVFHCFKHEKSLEKKLSGKISAISIAYGFVSMFGLLFILLGIVLPIAALFHAQNGHPHSLFGSWVYVVVWLWAAMYVIPSLGKKN